jgi:hypothetical protein
MSTLLNSVLDFKMLSMTFLRHIFTIGLLLVAFDTEIVTAQSPGAHEVSVLERSWDRHEVSMEDRIRAIEKLTHLSLPELTDDVFDEDLLTGLTPLDTTLKWFGSNLQGMPFRYQFWVARNLLGQLLVVDPDSTQLHDIVIELLASSSNEVRFQTVHTLLDVPNGSLDQLRLCRRIQHLIQSQLRMPSSDGQDLLFRRLLYKLQRALGQNDLVQEDVKSSLKYLSQDAEFDSAIIAEAVVSAATFHEFPIQEQRLVELESILYDGSDARALVVLVRYLFFGRPEDATGIVKVAQKVQHHALFFELLEKGQFKRCRADSIVTHLVVGVTMSEHAPPNVQLWRFSRTPFQLIIEGKSHPGWMNDARCRQRSHADITAADSAEEDAIILLDAIDNISFDHTLAHLMASDNEWYRLYNLENFFLIHSDFGEKIGALSPKSFSLWHVKYLIVRELSSSARAHEVITRDLLVSLMMDDQSPFFVLTRNVQLLAQARNIHFDGTAAGTLLREHACPDIRRASRAIAP